MLHPAAAHFAVSLPIISLILGIAYLMKPSELMSKISTRFMIFAMLFVFVAFFSGKEDGSEVYQYLSAEGKELLIAHKDFALYLVIGMSLAAIVKFFGCLREAKKLELVAIILVGLVSAGVLFQGKMGGELTFTHGAHVEKHAEGLTCLKEAEEFAD